MNTSKLILKTLVYLLIISSFANCGHSQHNIEAVIENCCENVNQMKTDNVELIHKMILTKYVEKLVQNEEEIKNDSIFEAFSLRLQKKCPQYLEKIYKTYDKGIWELHEKRPIVESTIQECRSFESIGSYYYQSDIGEVTLTINDGIWFEEFEDDTYSKLKFIKTEPCEFYLEFIESNNAMKMNFSKKGDKYNYQIIAKEMNSFTLSVQVPNSNQYYTSPMNIRKTD